MKAMKEALEMKFEEVEAIINTLTDLKETDEIIDWERVRSQIIIELNAKEIH